MRAEKQVNHYGKRSFENVSRNAGTDQTTPAAEPRDEPAAPLTPQALAACLNTATPAEARKMLGNALHLDLSGQELTQEGVNNLAMVLKEGNFTKLSLRGTKLPDITNVLNCFSQQPYSNPNLNLLELDLGGIQTSLTVDHFTAIAAILKENHFQCLNLSGLQINQDHATPIFEALKTNSSLRRLDLSSNPFNIDETLGKALGANLTLEELNLSSTQVDSRSLSHIRSALETQNSHQQNKDQIPRSGRGLRRLDLANCHITDSDHTVGLWMFIMSLKTNTSLTHLDLTGNLLERAGCAGLVEEAVTCMLLENHSIVSIKPYDTTKWFYDYSGSHHNNIKSCIDRNTMEGRDAMREAMLQQTYECLLPARLPHELQAEILRTTNELLLSDPRKIAK